jgi:hypothetical protein
MESVMKNTAETMKEPTAKQSLKAAKTRDTKVQEPAPETPQTLKAKEPKPAEDRKAKVEGESADRLPVTIDELKASKSGLVCYLFLSGKDKPEITKELKAAFDLNDTQADKITRRITGRVRFFRRVFELMTAK